MGHMSHTVDDRVTHVDVGGCHIDLGTEHFLSVLILAVFHVLEKFQVFFHGTITVGAVFTRLSQGSSVLADLLRREVADVGFAFFDKLDGILVHFSKVIGSEVESVLPVGAQPFDIGLDGLHELHFLFRGVGVVETHVEFAVIFLCKSII